MKIATSPSVRTYYPTTLPIPDEPGFVDLTVILASDWRPSYEGRSRQLRYVIVADMERAHAVLEKLGHAPSNAHSHRRNESAPTRDSC